MFDPSQQVAQFTIKRRLGRGGSATVFLARHRLLGGLCALKVLNNPLDPQAKARLQREGHALASLTHSNLVRVFDLFEHRGLLVLVMEYVDGQDLRALSAERTLSLDELDELVPALLRGIRAVHRKGLVHRDIKPANILITTEDNRLVPKLADFGLVRLFFGEATVLTHSHQIMGTPGYVAPEQLRNTRGADARADIFSLGCVLYELLTGQPAYPVEDLVSMVSRNATRPPAPITDARPDTPQRMIDAVMGALHAHPDKRFQDIDSLRAVWEGRISPQRTAQKLQFVDHPRLDDVVSVPLHPRVATHLKGCAACRLDRELFLEVWEPGSN